MTSNDTTISQYRDQIAIKRAKLGEMPKMHFITNASVPISGKFLNLNTINNKDHVVDVVRELVVQSQATEETNKILGTDVQYKPGGYSMADWIHDFKLIISRIEWKTSQMNLDQMDANLSRLVSEEGKTANALKDIANQLDL